MDAMANQSFTDQIRRAVDGSGLSRYAICKRIGVDQAVMSRFMSGKGGLSLGVLDRLAELLGLVVVAKGRPEKKG
jgi:transcriptional regulator with XRE-family HTH domain